MGDLGFWICGSVGGDRSRGRTGVGVVVVVCSSGTGSHGGSSIVL